MDNSRFMGSRQSGRLLLRDINTLFDCQGPFTYQLPKSSTVNELGGNKIISIDLTDFVNGQYIWMVQRGGRKCLLSESSHAFFFRSCVLRDHLHGNITIES